ncbi:MAG: hypothetical protein UMV23_01340 [Halanaerobium sp.]|nr:hypothetical protein [Halanaerobium sp.]
MDSGLVVAGIAPHGVPIITEVAGNELEIFRKTREGMEKFGATFNKYHPDTIIVLTPHGLRLSGMNAIYTCAYCRGKLTGGGMTISAEFKCDRHLAERILARAEEQELPVVGANYGALAGPASNIEMDWGTFIPLWYCGTRDEQKPKIVVVTPTRGIPLPKLVELGKIIAEQAEQSGKKVALIASADQAHTHDADGPYGYHPAAKEFDEDIVEIIRENQLGRLLDYDLQKVAEAKPDSIWQLLILHGVLQQVSMKVDFLSYQVPTYFGMAVATYERE